MTLSVPKSIPTAFHPALSKQMLKAVMPGRTIPFGMSQNTYHCFQANLVQEEQGFFAQLGQRLRQFLGLPESNRDELNPYQYIHTNFRLQPGWGEADSIERNGYSLNFWG
jgi:hypothetical protein